MKYSLIFAATAAAYDAYGKDSYGDKKATPSVAKPADCLTTITPGYGKEPVTITKQHQPYPTCVSKGYGDKSCDKWGEETYVHTTIKDYDGKDCVITKTNDKVTVYHEKKTITHTETGKYGGYPTPAGDYPKPTGAYDSKDKTDEKGCWYELYEKVETAEYSKLGKHALKGYPGSGLCKDSDKEQEVYVKEYKDGKWGNEYQSKHAYGKPEAEVTSYEKPGVYTIPAKDKTVDHTMSYGAEATKTAKAGETCTYGGQYIDAKETGYVTGAYGAYETSVYGDKTSTSTVLKYTTIYVSTTGKVEVCKPTTTVYDKDTTFAYPTASYYEPGVYHQDAKTVTVTKGGEAYTCEYKQTKKYEPTGKKGDGYPAQPTPTGKYDDSYGYKPEATPKKPTEGEKEYPSYPVPANSTKYDDKQVYGDKPGKPTEGEKGYPTPAPVYGDKPSKPEEHKPYGDKPGKPEEHKPVYGDKPGKPTEGDKDYPAKPVSTPCDDDKKPKPTPYKPSNDEHKPYGDKPNKPEGDKPVYGDKPNKPEEHKPYGDKPTEGDKDKPVYGDKPNKPEEHKPVYGDKPNKPEGDKPVYGDKPNKPEEHKPVYGDKPTEGEKKDYPATPAHDKEYPAKPVSTPCDDDKKGYPTPPPKASYGKRASFMARRAL